MLAMTVFTQITSIVCGFLLMGAGFLIYKNFDDDEFIGVYMPLGVMVVGVLLIVWGVGGQELLHLLRPELQL